MSVSSPALTAWQSLGCGYKSSVIVIAITLLISQIGFFVYGIIYSGDIQPFFSLVPNSVNCSLKALVDASQQLWIFPLAAPGVAVIAPALAIFRRTGCAECNTSQDHFVSQAKNEYSPLHDKWIDKLTEWNIGMNENWQNDTQFKDWFYLQCDVPHKVVTVLLVIVSVAVLEVVGLLVHFWVKPKWVDFGYEAVG
jgi:hypothetical protein